MSKSQTFNGELGTFDMHADPGITANEALLRDQRLLNCGSFVGHPPYPDTEVPRNRLAPLPRGAPARQRRPGVARGSVRPWPVRLSWERCRVRDEAVHLYLYHVVDALDRIDAACPDLLENKMQRTFARATMQQPSKFTLCVLGDRDTPERRANTRKGISSGPCACISSWTGSGPEPHPRGDRLRRRVSHAIKPHHLEAEALHRHRHTGEGIDKGHRWRDQIIVREIKANGADNRPWSYLRASKYH